MSEIIDADPRRVEKIQQWWRSLPSSDRNVLHQAAVDNEMNGDLAKIIHDSTSFVSGPVATSISGSPAKWSWHELMREVIVSEGNA